MPQTPHIERHFTSGETVRDIVIGMSDGLTVPFALAAGLSGAIASTHIVVTAGLAEVAAGAIAMGLGGYLAARSDSDHYASERRREEQEIIALPDVEAREIEEIFSSYGLEPAEIDPLVQALRRKPSLWADFMMRFELRLEKPDPNRALRSAMTIACAYITGGLIPLFPYMVLGTVGGALKLSLGTTAVALLLFGYVKGRFTGASAVRSAIQTMLIGGLAASAAFAIARAIA